MAKEVLAEHAGPEEWAIHEANIQQYGPLPLPLKFRHTLAAGRLIAHYPAGTFPIKADAHEPK